MCNKYVIKILLVVLLLFHVTLSVHSAVSMPGEDGEVLLAVDEYDRVKMKRLMFYTAEGRGFGVRFTAPSGHFRITSVLVFGTYHYWGSSYKFKAADNVFTVEVRDSKLVLVESFEFRYGDFFKGYDSLFSTGIPRDAPMWVRIPVDVAVGSRVFYVIVYPNAEFMPFVNSTYYGLYVGTDMYWADGRYVYPSKSSSYIFREGLVNKSVKFNFLIRVEGVVVPVYSVRVSTENLPSDFVLLVKNETSSFQLRGGESLRVDALDGSSFTVDEFVYGDKVRYHCVNPTQVVRKSRDIVFRFYPEYQVSVTTSPEDVLNYEEIRVNGSGYGRAFTGWFGEDDLVRVEAPYLVEGEGVKYIFSDFSIGFKDNVIEFRVKEPVDIIAEYRVQYYIEVVSEHGSASGSGWYDKGSEAEIKISRVYISIDEGSRYAFSSWEPLGLSDPVCKISVNGPMRIEAKWVTQYRVTVTSPYGNLSVSDTWVNKGDDVEIELSSTYVSTGFLVGKSLSHWVDQHGNEYYGNPLKITVDEPLEIRAVWRDNYIQLYIFLAIIIVMVIGIFMLMRRFRGSRLPPPPPPPPPRRFQGESVGGDVSSLMVSEKGISREGMLEILTKKLLDKDLEGLASLLEDYKVKFRYDPKVLSLVLFISDIVGSLRAVGAPPKVNLSKLPNAGFVLGFLEGLIDCGAENELTYALLGKAYIDLGMYDKARWAVKRGLRFVSDPNSPIVLMLVAMKSALELGRS
ncbi:MAG: hypothetical protein DRN95_02900 [Candidatus Hydrothermarchaeota archaeon]|nr:MAG: hypothetical protein DRN95_02900 [Candidatus Hydrothermarchaeota archaeon]